MIRSRVAETTERAHRVQAQEWKWGCWMRIIVLAAVSLAAVGCISMPTGRRESAVPDPLARAFMAEQRIEPLSFRLASSIRLRSPVYHPQGMTKVAGHFYVSAVEVIERPQRLPRADAGRKPERVQGRGRGHLFKFDERGNLVGQTTLGEGSIYHPGGIDYDGKDLLVPVAEYRPHSRSIVYRVDPVDLKRREAFRVDDHIGALVFNRRDKLIHGVSWGSREFYTWTTSGDLVARAKNGAHYVDYQDCQFVWSEYLLCSGMATYSLGSLGRFALGGVDLVRIRDYVPIHQIPVAIYPDEKNVQVVMTRNAMFAELRNGVLTFYFLPEDSNAAGNGSNGSAFGADAGEHAFSSIYIVETNRPAAVKRPNWKRPRRGYAAHAFSPRERGAAHTSLEPTTTLRRLRHIESD